MKKVSAFFILSLSLLLTGCAGQRKDMDAFVLKNHPSATIVTTFEENRDDGHLIYIICENGKALILEANNYGRPSIDDAALIPPDRVSCK